MLHVMPVDTGRARFAWKAEEAKLLWAQGQQAVAVSMTKSMLESAKANKEQDLAAYARLLSMTGKWLAESRYALLGQCLPGMSCTVKLSQGMIFTI